MMALGPRFAALLLSATGVYGAASIPAPNLDLSSLGQVTIAGNFDSISLYEGQRAGLDGRNGSVSLLTRTSSGAFADLGLVDADIMDMCPYVKSDGTFVGLVLCGNFTSVAGVQANSVAIYTPNAANPVKTLPGLSGSCNAVYCDQSSSSVYVGGNFMGGNSTNALKWTGEWNNLPFAGFNGPIMSITKNSAGNIVFGGSFDGLGNVTTPNIRDEQPVNLSGGDLTSSGATATSGFSSASNIVCKTGAQAGSGNTWLLADNTAGYWQGQFKFGFNPTKLRLYNANVDGRGAKTFYFEKLDSGGILNMSYVDSNGTPRSCITDCPLLLNSDAQDFRFSPVVGMSGFRIHITSWYGAGGGLSGIEVYQDDIYSYAVNDFNPPSCINSTIDSATTTTPASGTWSVTPYRGTDPAVDASYLSATLTSESQLSAGPSVVFHPNIKQSGNYSVLLWTPGCIQDNSCQSRGIVNVTGTVTSAGSTFATTLYQTNNYAKFDQIYNGYIDMSSSFRPTITVSPIAGQTLPLYVVAQKILFQMVGSTGGLNGLFEYNPSAAVSTDFTSSVIDMAGGRLNSGASVRSLIAYESSTIAAGSFSGSGLSNVVQIGSSVNSVAGGGLNGRVAKAYRNASEDTVYYVGAFTATADNSVTGLNHVAAYSLSGNKWSALGAGVDGNVSYVVPIRLNISSGVQADCIAFSGSFSSVNAFSGNSSFAASGFAVWVPSRNNWLHNLGSSSTTGRLTAFTMANGSPYWGGEINLQSQGLSDVVELTDSGSTLRSLGLNLKPVNAASGMRKRATNGLINGNYSGVYKGLYVNNNNLKISAFGGSFSTTASNGSLVQNLVFVNNTGSNQVITGVSSLGSDSVIMSLDVSSSTLFAGGSIGGSINGNSINGLFAFDLAANTFTSPQPPALGGDNVVVHTIATQPTGDNVYVGGQFSVAGSLPCASLCVYNTPSRLWNSPGLGLSGTVAAMMWSSSTMLKFAGNLSINGAPVSVGLYDASNQTFSAHPGASVLPGPVVAMSSVINDEFWVSGIASNNGSTYIAKYSGNTFTIASGLGASSDVRSLQVIPTTASHDNTALIASNDVLLLTGTINLSNYGNASSVLFNGTTYTPYLITSLNDGGPGTIAGVFVSDPRGFGIHSSRSLALGLVVLIGLAIALGLIFLLVLIGILIERQRRRAEGYVAMPPTRGGPNISRIPPSHLLAQLGEKGQAPRI
jgi:hypothetical protein